MSHVTYFLASITLLWEDAAARLGLEEDTLPPASNATTAP